MPELRLRPAHSDDAERVFEWANDPITRAASFSRDSFSLEDHLAWFAEQLTRVDRHPFLAELAGEPIAFVRLDASVDQPGVCTISINVAPEARGRGLGVAVIEAATPIGAGLGFDRIHALIRPDNHTSRRAFARAGYELDANTVGESALRYIAICALVDPRSP